VQRFIIADEHGGLRGIHRTPEQGPASQAAFSGLIVGKPQLAQVFGAGQLVRCDEGLRQDAPEQGVEQWA
jgi:hypothetical protein